MVCLGHHHETGEAGSEGAGQVEGTEVRDVRGSSGFVTYLRSVCSFPRALGSHGGFDSMIPRDLEAGTRANGEVIAAVQVVMPAALTGWWQGDGRGNGV